jgi:phospho-N-acetylmuramoyl-pentapeptide-transferase
MVELLAATIPQGRVSQIIPQIILPAIVYAMASFTIAMYAAPYVIRLLRRWRMGTLIRTEGPEAHQIKMGTPLMGGILFSGVTSLLTIGYQLVLLRHYSQLLTVGALISCSVLGMADDFLNTLRVGSAGLRARVKLAWTFLIAVIIVAVLHVPKLLAHPNYAWIPFHGYIDLGPAYSVLAILAIVATAHAVNLTDGLDGLAAGTGAIAFGTFGVIALLTHGYVFTGEFCFTLVGALLAFMWFNIYPARLFMGDTGSLALGACLATVALMLNQLLILPVIGFVYIIITSSVLVQVGYFKMSGGRRFFRMAPLHHHLQLVGWHENQITQRFWIVSMLCGAAGLALAFG